MWTQSIDMEAKEFWVQVHIVLHRVARFLFTNVLGDVVRQCCVAVQFLPLTVLPVMTLCPVAINDKPRTESSALILPYQIAGVRRVVVVVFENDTVQTTVNQTQVIQIRNGQERTHMHPMVIHKKLHLAFRWFLLCQIQTTAFRSKEKKFRLTTIPVHYGEQQKYRHL